jgi:hypothetical protein
LCSTSQINPQPLKILPRKTDEGNGKEGYTPDLGCPKKIIKNDDHRG